MTASSPHRHGEGCNRSRRHTPDRGPRQSIGARVLHALRLASPGCVTDRWLIDQCGIPDASLAFAIHRLRFLAGHRIKRVERGYCLLAQEKTPQDCNPRGLVTASAAATCELGHPSSYATKHTETAK